MTKDQGDDQSGFSSNFNDSKQKTRSTTGAASLRNFMTKDLVTIAVTDTVDRAHSIMSDQSLRHLPVVSESGQIIGLISDRDVKRAMRPSGPIDGTTSVKTIMSWPVEFVGEGQTLSSAGQLMIEKKISSVLVVNDKQVVGILTTEDLLRAFIEIAGQVEKKSAHEGARTAHEMREEMEVSLYNSPIGPIAQTLANAGL